MPGLEVVAIRATPLFSPLAVLSLVAAGFAGCLNAESQDGPAIISRVHTLTIDRSTQETVERYDDDIEGLIRELLRTDLVVRVDADGDYTLDYTDRTGALQTQALAGMTPGQPRTVSGADPMAPATLRKGDEVVVIRAGVDGAWWRVGDIPLGFNLTEPAKGLYAFQSRVEETIALRDLRVEGQSLTVQDARFELKLPIDGTVGYDLAAADGADGSPMTLTGSIEIPPAAGDIATLDVTASMNGEPGTAGAIAGVDEARASGSLRLWWQDGQPTAGQFLGGDYAADPRVTMWADGFFAGLAEGQSCAGKSKADRCEPEELERVSGTEAADDKETFPVGDHPVLSDPDLSADDREEVQAAIDVLRKIFALDIVEHDRLIVTAMADEQDLAAGQTDAPRLRTRLDFTLEAVAKEERTVPAGTFETLKITEEIRTLFSIADVKQPGSGETLFQDFQMDEVVARNTFWLETGTFRPIAMEASTPVNVDQLLKRMVDSVAPSAWEGIGGKPIENSDWQVTVTATSSYEAKELTGATHYAPLVGLMLAHSIASSTSAPLIWALGAVGMGGIFGAQTGYAEPAYEYDEPTIYPTTPRPVEPEASAPVSLSVTSAGPLVDGVKTYQIASASEGAAWHRLALALDGEDLYSAYAEDMSCMTPDEYQYVLCRAGTALDGHEDIEAGDQLSIRATPGATLRFIDTISNSVVMTITVG